MALTRRTSINRTDTAPIFDQPDYGALYRSMSMQQRNEQRYKDQQTRQRLMDFNEMTKVSLDPTITDEALKSFELEAYKGYQNSLKEVAKKRGDAGFNADDIVNNNLAQGELYKQQSMARDAQQRLNAATKEFQDPRNEGLFEEEFFNNSVEELRTYFRTGGKEGSIPNSFLDRVGTPIVPFFEKLGNEMETTSYSFKKPNAEGIMVESKYDKKNITKEQAGDIAWAEVENDRGLRKTAIKDWMNADPKREKYENLKEFVKNNDSYLNPLMENENVSYGETPMTSAERKAAGMSTDEDQTWLTFNNDINGYDMRAMNSGNGVRLASVDWSPNKDLVKEKTYKNATVINANPEDGWAEIVLDTPQEVDADYFGDIEATLKKQKNGEALTEQEMQNSFNYFQNGGTTNFVKKDPLLLKKIKIGYGKIKSTLHDQGIRFKGVDDVSGPTKYPLDAYTEEK